jgi:hypothetical protein
VKDYIDKLGRRIQIEDLKSIKAKVVVERQRKLLFIELYHYKAPNEKTKFEEFDENNYVSLDTFIFPMSKISLDLSKVKNLENKICYDFIECFFMKTMTWHSEVKEAIEKQLKIGRKE